MFEEINVYQSISQLMSALQLSTFNQTNYLVSPLKNIEKK